MILPPGPLARKPSSFFFENSTNHVSYAALSANPGYVGGGVDFNVEESGCDIVVIDQVTCSTQTIPSRAIDCQAGVLPTYRDIRAPQKRQLLV